MERAQALLADNPDMPVKDIRAALNCSPSYAYELRRIARNGATQERGHIVRKCLQIFGARPEVIVAVLWKEQTTAAVASTMSRKLEILVTPQYVAQLVRRRPNVKPSERKRILNLCR